MDMYQNCICCGSPMTEQVCRYCGFLNIVALDEAGEQQNQEDAIKHRKEIIEKLTNFSVNSYQYVWQEGTTGGCDIVKVKLADGIQCAGEIFWSEQEFQSFHKEDTLKSIEIFYQFDGKEKSVTCKIVSVPCESSCRIGLEIDPQLRLTVYLCYKDNVVKSEQMEFQFE